jgi:hypothetical protein
MIKFENFEVVGWDHAIRGMRNPKNSWERSDSHVCVAESTAECDSCDHLLKRPGEFSLCRQPIVVGPNDKSLMMRLRNAGTDHRKFMRMITVYVDITAPLYWWKEFDTYKVGTVANSCSTMHTIHQKEFVMEDFSIDERTPVWEYILVDLNYSRYKFLETNDKKYWKRMIQLLPTSYNQKRTVMMNYEVLANIYKSRKNHKLSEWHDLCDWAASLPYGELITGGEADD